jgi:hypothetical protein
MPASASAIRGEILARVPCCEAGPRHRYDFPNIRTAYGLTPA